MPGTAPDIILESSDMTTEFLNALASVHSLSEILRDHPDIDHRQKQRFIDIILAETQRMTAMAGDQPAGAGRLRLEFA